MAILHVSASGSNTSPFETWAKAATDIQSVDGVASVAGDTVYLSHVYSSGYSGSVTINFSNGTLANPIKIISADETTGSPADGDASTYATGALLTTSSGLLAIQGHIRLWGVNISTTGSADIQIISGVTTQRQEWHEGTITNVDQLVLVNNAHESYLLFRRCSFIRNAAGAEATEGQSRGSRIEYIDCTWTKTAGVDYLQESLGPEGMEIIYSGCDVSAFGNILQNAPAGHSKLLLRGCEVASGVDLLDGTMVDQSTLTMEACSNGTLIVAELGVSDRETFFGTVKSTLAKHRTGGADDGDNANAHAWDMVSSANALELVGPLVSPPIVKWVGKDSAITLTIFVAHNAVGSGASGHLQDDEIWVEWSGPAEATATARRYVERTNDTTAGSVPMNPLDSPSDVDSDSSTWTGSNVGIKDKFVLTSYTPDIEGPVTARVYLAKPSVTVTIDPKIVET